MSPMEALGIAVIVIATATPVIAVGVVYYLKKRLEHKQILAAIEKGTPLSELRPPKQNGALWIKNLTIGIALLIVGLAIVLSGRVGGELTFVAYVLIGVGAAWTVRGVLNRKYQVQSQPSAENVAGENKNPADVSASEALQQAD
ncbi:MAG: hypothetical protein ACYSYV_00625 [Planctomycetota bacterium]